MVREVQSSTITILIIINKSWKYVATLEEFPRNKMPSTIRQNSKDVNRIIRTSHSCSIQFDLARPSMQHEKDIMAID